MMRADPENTPDGRRRPSWRDHYGWGREADLLADLWDAIVQTAPRGKGKKAPKPYDRPGKVKPSRRRFL